MTTATVAWALYLIGFAAVLATHDERRGISLAATWAIALVWPIASIIMIIHQLARRSRG